MGELHKADRTSPGEGVYYRQQNQGVEATKPFLSDVEPQDTVFFPVEF